MKLFTRLACIVLCSVAAFSLHAQCTIDTSIQTHGFHPDTGSYLPKACAGSNYNTVIQIYAPQNVTIQLGTFPVNYVQLDSIPALPASLAYSTNPVGGKMNGGERGCIDLYGTVTAPAGTYNFIIYYTANFTAFGNAISLPFQAPYKLVIDTGSAVYATLQATTCQGIPYEFDGKLFNTSGTYYDTLMQTVSHCDSIVTLELTVLTTDTTITVSNGTLQAASGYDGYQWYDCNAQMAINNANSSSYTPTVTGGYAVVVDNGNCSAMSECMQITISSVNELTEQVGLQPNPANNVLWIKTAVPFAGNAKVFNTVGEMVLDGTILNGSPLNISQLPKGLYYIMLNNGKTSGAHFIKQ